MKGMVCWLVVAFAGMMAAHQGLTGLATISGIVTNLETGQPVVDMRVMLTSDANVVRFGTTDETGLFRIPSLSPGRYAVTLPNDQFFYKSGPRVLTVLPGEDITTFGIGLVALGVVSGRVVDQDGNPLASVRVEALRNDYSDGLKGWKVARSATSDSRGQYRLFGLLPGAYYVRSVGLGDLQREPPIYYPATRDPSYAVPLPVEVARELGGIDLVRRRFDEFSLQFRLGGVTPGRTTFYVRWLDSVIRESSGDMEYWTVSLDPDSDRLYRIAGLSRGMYEIVARVTTSPTDQQGVIAHTGRLTVNLIGDVDLGTWELVPNVPLLGHIVHIEAGVPVDVSRLSIALLPTDLPPGFYVGASSGTKPIGNTIAADGTFKMPNVPRGLFRIRVTGLPINTYLLSARAGGQEVIDTGLTVTNDAGPLELFVGGPNSVGIVEGNVVNAKGEPVSDRTVTLLPDVSRRNNPSAFRTSITDQAGNFTILGVRPGEYRILAWDQIEAGLYQRPEFLLEYESRAQRFMVQAGAKTVTSATAISLPQ